MVGHLARDEAPFGEVVAVLGPSRYSCSAVLCSEGLSWPAASQRADLGGGDGDRDLCFTGNADESCVVAAYTKGLASSWDPPGR